MGALIRFTAQKFLLAIEFKDLEVFLGRAGECRYSARQIFKCFGVVTDILNGYERDSYNCSAGSEEVHVTAPQRLLPQMQQAVPQSTLLHMLQAATRVCEALELPYSTQVRIHDVLKSWNERGFAGNTTSTTAAAAVWSVVKSKGAKLKAVAEAAGCAPNAIPRVLKKHV